MSVWGVYALAINVFLSTPLFERVINQEPDVIDIHFERGWSLWPTRIHARNLSIRGGDSNVDWILRLDHVVFEVSLMQLTKQKFDVSMADGSGLSFRARQTLKTAPESEHEYADLPPIDGLPPFRVKPEPTQHDKDEVWNDAVYKLWTVQLESVHARDVREIWIDKAHFVGAADIQGRFYLKPIREVSIGPIHVVADGRVFVGEHTPAIENAHAEVTTTIATFDPRTVKGNDLMHRVSFDFEGHARVPSADELPLPLPHDMMLAGTIDVRRLAIRLKDGVFVSDSHLDAVASEASVFTKRHLFTGAFSLRGDIAEDGERPRLTFRLNAMDLGMSREIQENPRGFAPFLRAREVIITGDSRELDTGHALRDLHTLMDVNDAELPKASALGLYLPKHAGVAIRKGAAHASAHLESWFADRRVQGHAKLDARDLEIAVPNMLVLGSTEATARFASFQWEEQRFDDLQLDLKLDRGSLASARAPTEALVEVKKLLVRLRSPAVQLETPFHDVSANVEISEAAVIDQSLLRRFLPEDVRIASGRARFSMGMDLKLRDAIASGTATIAATQFGFVVKEQKVVADVRGTARVHDWNLDRGTLSIDEVRVDVERARMNDATIKRIAVRASLPSFSFEKPTYGPAELDVDIDGAAMPDARVLSKFFPKGSDTSILSGHARVSANVRVSAKRQTATGGIDVALQNAGIRFEKTDLTGDFRVLARARGYDRAKKRVDLTGSLMSMTHVSTTNTAVAAKNWDGEVSIVKGGISFGERPELDVVVKIDARDANPALAVIFKNDLPSVVAGLTEMPHLDASARITLAPKWLGLYDVVARGGDFGLHGSYASSSDPSAGERRRGAFIVEKGIFSVGLRFHDDVVAIRFFGLDGWMREQQRLVAAPPE